MRSFKGHLTEAKETIVFTFGRFNPPTTGHEKLIAKVASVAGSNKFRIYPSHTQNPKKDPLPHALKVAYMRKMFKKYSRNIIADKSMKTAIMIAEKLYSEGFKNLIMVVGSDRVEEFSTLLNRYNDAPDKKGKQLFKFDSVEVVSAGERDPDSEGVEGMSASKMRTAAADGDKDSFLQGVPSSFNDGVKLYRDVRKYLGIREDRDMGEMTDFETIRDMYLTGKIWNAGDTVEAKGIIGEVVRKGTNYLSFVDEEGKVHKVWLHEITLDELSIGKMVDYSVKSRKDALKHHRLFKGKKTTAKDDEIVKKRMRGDKLAGKKLDKKYAQMESELDEEASVYKKTATKAKNKEGTLYAFGRDKKLDGQPNEKGGYIVWKLAQNYAGHVKGGISKRWVYIKKDLSYPDAVKLMNKRLKYKAFNAEVELDERNYRKEYDNYQGQPEQIARRSSRNKARRVMGDKTKIGMDVGHRDNDPLNNDPANLRNEDPSENRREPRLRGEAPAKIKGKVYKPGDKPPPGGWPKMTFGTKRMPKKRKKEETNLDEMSWYKELIAKLSQIKHPTGYEKMAKAYAEKMKEKKYRGQAGLAISDITKQTQNITPRQLAVYINKLVNTGIFPKELKAEYEPVKEEKLHSFKEFVNQIQTNEKLVKGADAGEYIKDFEKSNAPQFKGKTKENRKKMAIAAFLNKKKK